MGHIFIYPSTHRWLQIQNDLITMPLVSALKIFIVAALQPLKAYSHSVWDVLHLLNCLLCVYIVHGSQVFISIMWIKVYIHIQYKEWQDLEIKDTCHAINRVIM